MGKKIAEVDNKAMNALYASELAKAGAKIAATDDKGAPVDPVAFSDHEEYTKTLASVLKDDKSGGGGDPNDKIQD